MKSTSDVRARIMSVCAAALRLYTRHAPFRRGRGMFLRLIAFLQRRGWPAPLIPIAGDMVMELEPSLIEWTLFERGEWEPEQTAVFLSLVRPGDVVLNVGANTGFYTLLAARRAGERGRVHAFEIQPRILEILRRNLAHNALGDRVTVVEMGCFSSAGEAVIEAHGDPGSARISFDSAGVRVPLTTLDLYCEALDRVDVVLIDAEGADFEILRGASRTLERFRPAVIAEVHHLGAFGGSEEALRAYMARFGYDARELQGEFSRDVLFERKNAC